MKNTYILLRNNVESSSLSFDELQQIGLQQSDLIWVECQSVCWQNPLEIPELKKLLSAAGSIKNANHNPGNIDSYQSPIFNELQENTSNKLVHVEWPAKEKASLKKIAAIPQRSSDLSAINKYGNPDKTTATTVDKKNVDLKTGADISFDEITERVFSTPEKKKSHENIFFGLELPKNVKKIAVYIGLVASGALMMLLVMNTDGKNKTVQQAIPIIPQSERDVATTIATPTESEEETPSLPESFEQQNIQTEVTPTPALNRQEAPAPAKTKLPVARNEEKIISSDTHDAKPVKESQPVSEVKIPGSIPVENIIAQLSIIPNDYNIGSFGGIKNLEITLQNKSNYLLDKVTVQIQYLNPEGNIVNSDNIYFQSVQPGDTETIPVKKSKRGVKLSYKITKVESKELTANNSKSAESNIYSKN